MTASWVMRGSVFGPCNCDWGCPCNFNAAPTYGHCDGVYLFSVREGRYGDVPLEGLHFAWAAHAPGPLHYGNVRALLLVDERASEGQRQALEQLWRSGSAGIPFDILNSVTATWHETVYATFEVELAGNNTMAKIGGGRILELALSRVKNPVTDEEERLYLDKPTGFTSTRSELGTSTVARFSSDGFPLDDMSGKYADYADFEYAGP
jgi:hypothetical protein